MNIIVTGASRGIGYELVKVYCTNNANTIITIARNGDKLQHLKRECLAINPQAKVIPIIFDLRDTNLEGLLEIGRASCRERV